MEDFLEIHKKKFMEFDKTPGEISRGIPETDFFSEEFHEKLLKQKWSNPGGI